MRSLILLTVVLIYSSAVFAEEKITLATFEKEPYITLSRKSSYVYDVLTAAFSESGYTVDLVFVPPKRAALLAETGRVTGVVPVQKRSSDSLSYSSPFPGDKIGIVMTKNSAGRFASDRINEFYSALSTLKNLHVGVRSGDDLETLFENTETSQIRLQWSQDDFSNIYSLLLGRLDAILVDKHAAAETITRRLPQHIGELKFINPPILERPFYVGFSKRHPKYIEYLDAFNSGFAIIERSGELREIQKRHGLFPTIRHEDDQITLRIGTIDNIDMEIMQELSVEYQKLNPNVNFEWRVTDENTLRTRLLGELAVSDGQYDIITIGSYEVPIWADYGWLTEIKNFPASYDYDDLLLPVRIALSKNGKLYGLPFYAESSITYFRKDLLEIANLTISDSPTYEEILTLAKKLHNPADGIYGICLRGKAGWGSNIAFISTMANSFGGRWFDPDWQPTLNTASWTNALSMYLKLAEYSHPESHNFNYVENLELFASGQCALWIDATIAAGSLSDPGKSLVSGDVGYAKAPYGSVRKGSNWLWVWSLAIPVSSRQPEQALDFIYWATSKSYIDLVGKNKGWIYGPMGTRASTYAGADTKREVPFSEFVLRQILASEPLNSSIEPIPYSGIQFVAIPEFAYIGDRVGSEFRDILLGRSSIADALSNAQEITRQQMERSGYYSKH